jgi:hypothetical protein
VTWVIRSLDHLRNGNPVNIENQTHRYFLMFPTHPYMTYLGKQNQSYSDLKAGSKRRIQQKLRNRLGSEARVRFCSRTKLMEQLGQKWSIAHDLFRLETGFQSGNFFSSILPFWIESVLNERSSLNSMLTSNGIDLGKMPYIQDVYNFDIFPASINTSSFDKWFRSNDL